MNVIKIFFNNFKFYGFVNYIKIIFYEIFYQIYFLRFSDFKTNRPLNIKIKSKTNSYNEKYLPTPYYFLEIINQQIFKIPKEGCLNIHTGLVQGFRGTDSCYWAIFKRKPEYIGATIHQIDSGIDNGDVLIQKKQISIN